ncbi:hypothetical protein XI06_15245 [Bradyrhizobium sp. CCBAU 11434]|uniref:hypothetical protein n=1 Tax=Bradyrhizobium sp. CCBAU 11434 TaxID=1630885 RepID=UPI002305E0D1|nr:hypothetical protein [Bradyrhizobium sp. CCBAU 11434]MDA9521659.1 hypothetical protein [Bradyrhizobium sp. CCBAU 11434]
MTHDPDHPDTVRLVEARLEVALHAARSNALGMPSSVETLRAMLDRAGLALVPKDKTGGGR